MTALKMEMKRVLTVGVLVIPAQQVPVIIVRMEILAQMIIAKMGSANI